MPPDAVVVGSGPNGLAAGIVLAQAGVSTVIYEASETTGGGARSKELTLPGFVHDVCSAIHPLAVASPFFRSLPLERFGLKWIRPEIPLANPFEDGSCALLYDSLERTAKSLGEDSDEERYFALFDECIEHWEGIVKDILGPLTRLPARPVELVSFLLSSLSSVRTFCESNFRGRNARALFGGAAAHAMLGLDQPITNGFAMVLLILAHSVGWPFPEGGSQRITDALAGYFRSLGGEIKTGFEVKSLDDLPASSKVVLFDLTPRQVLRILGDKLPRTYRRTLESFRYGPGAFKVDYALDGPIPWKSKECSKSGTVHVCGDIDQIASSERAVWEGRESDHPFVIVAQQSLFDRSRAPEGKHTAWAYCHVPNGSQEDMRERIERQIERFAPGFKKSVLACHSFNPMELERYDANYVGGDINGGLQDLWQTIARPALSFCPYKTPTKGIYICSSSTPPGGGVHGMCGYYAAKAAISGGELTPS